MLVSEFDFDLPADRIALRPARPRDSAKLLVVRPDGLADRQVRGLAALLKPGDVLVFNDTKVIPAALSGQRVGRGGTTPKVDALLHSRIDSSRWKAFAKPGKKLEVGDRIRFGEDANLCLMGSLDAVVEAKGEGGEITLRFEMSGPVLDEAVALAGKMPLPPYIAGKRPPDDQDRSDYQTLYAREEGAVAAPTAGLHFTPDLFKALQTAGIGCEFVTLHVGAGTFLPMKSDDTKDHRMHAERGEVGEGVALRLRTARANGSRIVAVGTTSLRLLESAGGHPFKGLTDIFITPGYQFRQVDLLITNFHLPRSTLFMLVCAFAGTERMKSAYDYAIANFYRFYSYGDASLLFPTGND